MKSIKSLVVPSMFIAAAALLGGCVGAELGGEPEGSVADEDIGSDRQELWTITSNVSSHWWDSGITASLSTVQSVKCAVTYGSNYLLTRLRGWREPSGNLDNFIARLNARCTRYDAVSHYMQQDTSTHEFDEVFVDSHDSTRDGISAIDVTTHAPIGLRIALDSGSGYVQDVALLHGHFVNDNGFIYIDNYASPHQEEWAMGIGGTNTRTLDCPDQNLMTGIELQYSTSSGKIRYLNVFCRQALP